MKYIGRMKIYMIKRYSEERIKQINEKCNSGIETPGDLYVRMELEKILDMIRGEKDVY